MRLSPLTSARAVRFVAVFAVAAAASLVFAACEKPDASYVTSPSIKTLIGTTTGNVAFNPPETAPAPTDNPPKWDIKFNLARFTELENGSPAMEILMQVDTLPGYGFELWISGEDGKTAARWTAGSTTKYEGTACFQLELQRGAEAVPLPPGKYHATLAFRDPEGPVLVAKQIPVTNFTPKLEGTVPGPTSEVFREAWACRRGQ
ncbi:MAG TPA: hypothetical protein PKI89_01395 [Tepidiformaceae bacterium]|nr:hypothetical protein [Tepidiformaceae bacterium]